MAESPRSGSRPHGRDVRVGTAGPRAALSPPQVRRAVATVLDGERAGPAAVSVTFVSPQRMRALSRQAFGHDRSTDVIAFRLEHHDTVAGDIYLCPMAARRAARSLGIPEREELFRLVVHGTLHVLGYDHPGSARRVLAPMWRRQERYVRQLTEGPR